MVGIDAGRPTSGTLPSKTLPTMLSCRQISPSAQFAVGGEAGELGAGAGAAGRAVVGLAGAEDEVAAVGAGRVGGPNSSMWSISRRRAGDALRVQRLADAPGEVGQALDVVERELLAVIARTRKNQLPPQATSPRDGADSRALPRGACCALR